MTDEHPSFSFLPFLCPFSPKGSPIPTNIYLPSSAQVSKYPSKLWYTFLNVLRIPTHIARRFLLLTPLRHCCLHHPLHPGAPSKWLRRLELHFQLKTPNYPKTLQDQIHTPSPKRKSSQMRRIRWNQWPQSGSRNQLYAKVSVSAGGKTLGGHTPPTDVYDVW